MKKPLSLPLIFWLLLAPLAAQQPASIAIHVSETAGIRRTMYPVTARVEIPEHGAADTAHIRLRQNGTDVPAQFQASDKWTDGSVRHVEVDFNASIAPRETLDYVVEYGGGVATGSPARGLVVTDGADTIQVGNVTFGRSPTPFLRSVKYRDEDIADGPNGFGIVDASGQTQDLGGGTATVVKSGPLDVTLRFVGTNYTLNVEMPNSKTWVKATATIQDPTARLRSIVFRAPLSLGAFPLLWDFGTAKGTYGVFRAATDSTTLTETPKAAGRTDWHVDVSAGGRPAQPVEADQDSLVEARWGHIQGAKEAIAFAAGHPEDGSSVFSIDGTGRLVMQFTPAHPAREHSLTVYLHFVPSPVQIGAATTPAAMLAPLVVR